MELLKDKNGTRVEIGDTVTDKSGKEFKVALSIKSLCLVDNDGNSHEIKDTSPIEVTKFAENDRTLLPSSHKLNEEVALHFGGENIIRGCRVSAITFYEDKVRYDVIVSITGDRPSSETVLYEVDSAFVFRPTDIGKI